MANVGSAIAPQAKAASEVKEVTAASFRADVLTASTRRPASSRLIRLVSSFVTGCKCPSPPHWIAA